MSADRFERWAIWILGFGGGLTCSVLLGVALGDVLYRPLVGDAMAEALVTKEGSASWYITLGLAVVVGVAGVVTFVLLLRRRPRLSREYAQRCYERGRYDALRSPALLVTLAAWVALIVGLGLGFGPGSLAAELDGEPVLDASTRTPETALLSVLAVVAAILLSGWRTRRHWEIEPLLDAGFLMPARPPEEPVHGWLRFREGFHAWAMAALITGGQVVLAWLQGLIDGVPMTMEERVGDLFLNIVGYPAAIAVALFVIFYLSPMRWVVREALTSPIVKIALVCAILGGFLMPFTQHPVVLVAAAAGWLIAGVTMLRLMDTGPQPWLGIIFLITAYWVGIAYDPAAETLTFGDPVPHGIFGWLGAVLAAALIVYDVRTHWLSRYGVRHASDAAGAAPVPDRASG